MEEKKAATQEIIDNLKRQGCAWPNCGLKPFMSMAVRKIEIKDGKMKPLEGMSTVFNFCDYHFAIASAGLCVAVQDIVTPNKSILMAPFEAVSITESVVAGMVFSGQIDKLMEARKNKLGADPKFEQELEEYKKHNEPSTNKQETKQ